MMSRIMVAAILTANSDHLLTHCAVLAASVFSYAHTRQRIASVSVCYRNSIDSGSATDQQYFSLRINQPPAISTFLLQQTSISDQPPAKRTGWLLLLASILSIQE
jgi:hypothetical protein